MDLRNGDCLELMKSLPDKSVDLMICDLPYGETNCKWDTKLDMVQFWEQFKRIRKSKKTACIHFCSTKFGYTLIKSNEKMFKMDMVWKKRNKTGGLQSRYRPMRNHEMVYFFYEQAPMYNRDKYHKRIAAKEEHKTKNYETKSNEIHERTKAYMSGNKNLYDPRLPASVVEEKPKKKRNIRDSTRANEKKDIFGYNQDAPKPHQYDPPNPASIVEEKSGGDIYGEKKIDQINRRKEMYKKSGNVNNFEPPNPASVVEEKDLYGEIKSKRGERVNGLQFDPPNPASILEEELHVNIHGLDKSHPTWGQHNSFVPPNPASVVEEKDEFGWDKSVVKEKGNKIGKMGGNFSPVNPVSIIEEDEPVTMFESTKVFIGKRHHQTEKPQDILEFFLKYWTNEKDTVLDPTMGSGSTGVACKKLDRNFIGFELDSTIFEVAKKRCEVID
mgnify:CR=1 FL=1